MHHPSEPFAAKKIQTASTQAPLFRFNIFDDSSELINSTSPNPNDHSSPIRSFDFRLGKSGGNGLITPKVADLRSSQGSEGPIRDSKMISKRVSKLPESILSHLNRTSKQTTSHVRLEPRKQTLVAAEYAVISPDSTEPAQPSKAERLSLQVESKNLMTHFLGAKRNSHSKITGLFEPIKHQQIKEPMTDRQFDRPKAVATLYDSESRGSPVGPPRKLTTQKIRSNSKSGVAKPLSGKVIPFPGIGQAKSKSKKYIASILETPSRIQRTSLIKNVYSQGGLFKLKRPKLYKKSVKASESRPFRPNSVSQKTFRNPSRVKRTSTCNHRNKNVNVSVGMGLGRDLCLGVQQPGLKGHLGNFGRSADRNIASQTHLVKSIKDKWPTESDDPTKTWSTPKLFIRKRSKSMDKNAMNSHCVIESDPKTDFKGVTTPRSNLRVIPGVFKPKLKGLYPTPKGRPHLNLRPVLHKSRPDLCDPDRYKSKPIEPLLDKFRKKVTPSLGNLSPNHPNSSKIKLELSSEFRIAHPPSLPTTNDIPFDSHPLWPSFRDWEEQFKQHLTNDLLAKEVVKSVQSRFHQIETSGFGEFKTLPVFYRIDAKLVEGSFSSVFRATQMLTGCPVALKLIPKESLLKNVKLHQEIFILKKIRNKKYMMRLLEVFEDQNNLYLIMEYHNRGDLITYLNNRALLSEEELAPIFKRIVLGIRTLHQLNIIHRDIKMDNILLDRKGKPVISDFGISSIVQPDTLIKDTGGTPAYLAPEVINALGGICFKTDVWGLGVLLYTLVFGILPFKGCDFQELYKNILSENFDFPVRSASDSLKDLIRKMLKVGIKARLDIDGILSHEWVKRHTTDLQDLNETTDELPKLSQKTKDQYLRHLNDVGFPMDHLYESHSTSKMNHATACFENLRINFE